MIGLDDGCFVSNGSCRTAVLVHTRTLRMTIQPGCLRNISMRQRMDGQHSALNVRVYEV